MSTVDADEVIQSVTVEDVTDDKENLDIAFMIVASSYINFSTYALDIQDVYQELCSDIYHEKGYARTLLAKGISPLTRELSPLGTVRVVISPRQRTDTDLPPLEAMSLVSPLEGWELFEQGKFDPFHSAEIGRFALASVCRGEYGKKMNLPIIILQKVFEQATYISAAMYGKTQLWAIMPPPVAKFATDAGLSLLTSTEIVLNYQKHAELFKRYSKYWINANPKLYELAF